MSDFFFFDCETTGLPVRRNLSVRDVEGWPRLVQLAWATYDAWGRPKAAQSHIIRPEGFLIPAESTKIHGISHARAVKTGAPAQIALADVMKPILKQAEGVLEDALAFEAARQKRRKNSDKDA